MKIIKRVQLDPPNPIEIFYVETIENNGQIIEVGSLQKITSGVNYASFLAILQAEVNSVSPTPVANWRGFNTNMWQNQAYGRIRMLTTDQISATQLESLALAIAAGMPYDLPIFITLWNKVITASPQPPTLEEALSWQAIAVNTNMPFTINDTGAIDGTPN